MRKIRICLISLLFAEQALVPVAVAVAQTGPDINPQFQSASRGGAAGGGPIAPGAASPAPSGEGEFTMPVASPPGVPLKEDESGRMEAPLYEDTETRTPLDAKVSVNLENAPLTAFLHAISAQTRISFILAEGLQERKITAYLRQISVREAMQILLQIRGLTYQRIGKTNTYVVTKRSAARANLVTKIYTLSYISLLSPGSAQQDLSSITSSANSNNPFTSSSSSGSSGGTGGVSAGSAATGIAILNVINSMLTPKLGRVVTEPRTNSVIITDLPEVFPQIETVLNELDRKAPQISIEAEIVEISTTRLNELGIEWGDSRGGLATFTGPTRQTDYFLRPGFFSGDNWKNLYPAVGSSGLTNGTGITYGTLSLQQLTAVLRLLVSRSAARFLGKPNIVTMNNNTAIVTISRDAATSVTTNVSQVGQSGTVERSMVGVTLRVTPQVNKDGYVTLLIQPSFSDIQASNLTNNGSTVYDPVSRGASAIVRVKNGQTVAMGGLLQTKDTTVVRKVPLLGYIPIIGWLFTSSSTERDNTDLVIFIKPTIQVD